MKVPQGKYEFWWLMRTGELPCPKLTSSINAEGYILIMPTIRKYKYLQEKEHRIVMEEWLCRKLGRFEFVHHINGNREDNRLENLALCSPKEHKTFHPCRKGWHHTDATKAELSANWRRRRGLVDNREINVRIESG